MNLITTPQNRVPSEDRRRHLRQRASSIIYLKVDDGNGGILLNMGTGGLSLQAVAALDPEQDLILHFRFFDTKETITVAGCVAWLGPTRKEAGICFKDLPDRTEQSIAGWIARQQTGSHATESKVASPVNAVPPASEIPLPPPQVSIVSIPAGGTALDLQPSPSTALPSESHLGGTPPEPASSKPSTPPAFGTSLPAPIPTNALPKEHSAAPTVNPTEVPSEPLQPILMLELSSPSEPSKEFLREDRAPPDSPMPLSSTDAASGDKSIPPMPMLSSPQGKQHHRVLIVAGLAVCFGILVLILMATNSGKHPENTGSSAPSAPAPSGSPPAAVAPDVSPAVGTALPAPPKIVRRPTETGWMATLKRIFSRADDSRALDPAVDGISVWVDKRSGFYYCADSPYFAKLQPGSAMTQGDALQSGYQPKIGSYCR